MVAKPEMCDFIVERCRVGNTPDVLQVLLSKDTNGIRASRRTQCRKQEMHIGQYYVCPPQRGPIFPYVVFLLPEKNMFLTPWPLQKKVCATSSAHSPQSWGCPAPEPPPFHRTDHQHRHPCCGPFHQQPHGCAFFSTPAPMPCKADTAEIPKRITAKVRWTPGCHFILVLDR